MGLALLIIFMFVAYGLTTLLRRWIDIPTLLAVAIGCAVNANLLNHMNVGARIEVGIFTFTIEIVLFTLFMYTISVRILDYGFQDAKRMTFTSIAAILISAFIELVSNLAVNGASSEMFKIFSYYLVSSIGTIVAVWVMVAIVIACRKKNINKYFTLVFAIVAACLIHSIIYYGSVALIEWKKDIYPLMYALSAMMGKSVCIALGAFCYFINQKYWMPLNLVKAKEEDDNK